MKIISWRGMVPLFFKKQGDGSCKEPSPLFPPVGLFFFKFYKTINSLSLTPHKGSRRLRRYRRYTA